MADKIRVGIVGATVTQGGSGWGANAHVPALKALPQYELKAVCTAHEDTAAASAKAFGAARGFHRFSDMAAAPDIDPLPDGNRITGNVVLDNGASPDTAHLPPGVPGGDLLWSGAGAGNCWSENLAGTTVSPVPLPSCG